MVVEQSSGLKADPRIAVAPKRYGKVRLPRTVGFVAISVALLAFFIAAGAPAPLLPLYETDWGFAHSMLTLAFGAYAIAMLLALLVIGSLSDHIGRRPVLIGALALELTAMIGFLTAPSVEWLIVWRIVQGLATGAASSSFGAAVVELAPEHRQRLGASMSSLASTAGIGIGAFFAALVAQFIPSAAASTVWLVLAIVMGLGVAFALITPESATRKPGAISSLAPRIFLPRQVRLQFANTVPGVVAGFMYAGLFLGLIPIIFAAVFGEGRPAVGGLATFVMFGVGAFVSAVTGGVHPHKLKVLGNTAMTVGALLFIGSIAMGSFALVWLGAALAGVGIGATYSGTIRGLVPEVDAHERAGVFSAIFIVAYLSLGVSAIIAGVFATAVGVAPMAIGFGTVLAITSAAAVVLSVGLTVSRTSPAAH